MKKFYNLFLIEYRELLTIPIFVILISSTLLSLFPINETILYSLKNEINFLNSFLTLFGFTLTSYAILFGLTPKFTKNFRETGTFKKLNQLFFLSLLISFIGIFTSILFIINVDTLVYFLIIMGILNIYFLLIIIMILYFLFKNNNFYQN